MNNKSTLKQLTLGLLMTTVPYLALANGQSASFHYNQPYNEQPNYEQPSYERLPYPPQAYEQPRYTPFSSQSTNPTSNASLLNLQNTSYANLPIEHSAIVQASELMAPASAKSVLQQARIMTLDEQRIISGGCWDYLNEVFSLAGAGRETVFKGSYNDGPYAPTEQLRAGDWLYFVNHGYHDIEHSGLFIGWINADTREALVLSYAGEDRREPARYKAYDVSNVYQIIRPTL